MALQHTLSKIAFGFLIVLLSTDVARCADREEVAQVAKEILIAIERKDPEGILKYIHDTVCFDIYCDPPDRVRQLLTDAYSVPSDMLFSGEYSIHDYLSQNTDISIQENPYTKEPGSWEIRLNNPVVKPPSPAFIYVSKHPSGWTITAVRF